MLHLPVVGVASRRAVRRRRGARRAGRAAEAGAGVRLADAAAVVRARRADAVARVRDWGCTRRRTAWSSLGQADTHESPSQVTLPPVGVWHAVHDVLSFGPHVATALLSHALAAAQVEAAVTLQRAHAAHADRRAVGIGGASHAAGSAPGRIVVRRASRAAAGSAHVSARAAGEAARRPAAGGRASRPWATGRTCTPTCRSCRRWCCWRKYREQLWVPLAHTPLHAALLAMQVPAHSFMPDGQAGTHCVPSHVTEPPVGCIAGGARRWLRSCRRRCC